jgi:formylglycine-generating enzyme required for sulfatase activity
VLGKRQLASVDASKPDAAIQTCASACDTASQCQGFDFSIVYGNCTLYSTIEKKSPLAGYISGTRVKQQVALATPAKPVEASDAVRPGSVFRDCPECPEMVVVPGGEFMMGSPWGEDGRRDNEGPQHKVTIAKPFAVGKYEVTFAEWDACLGAGGCRHKPDDSGWGRGRRPVINVSWDDITKEYLPWLSRKTGKSYRLLSETEWEYAARAGTSTPFSMGPIITTDQANFDGMYTLAGGSTRGERRQKTIDVGSFKPNGFGLHDVHGNVWEWVEDCYNDGYAGTPADGSAVAAVAGCFRGLRGGSWSTGPQLLRSGYRFRLAPDIRYTFNGFRLARTLNP